MKSERKLFLGVLANVDNSILNVKLDYNFEIKILKRKGIIDNLHKNLGFSELQINSELSNLKCNSNDKIYCITKDDYDPSESQEVLNKHWEYLVNTINLIRLFKKGNIRIAIIYQIRYNPFTAPVFRFDKFVHPELFQLKSEEVPKLMNFIKIRYPFRKTLQLAFNNFNLSYEVENVNLQFLSLMNGMEVLFNPSGGGELTYRISRNTAVLLGQDKIEAENIEKKMKILYQKRSNIVHTGDSNIEEDDLSMLRYYIRNSIKAFLKLDQNKADILKSLNSRGFGDSPLKNL